MRIILSLILWFVFSYAALAQEAVTLSVTPGHAALLSGKPQTTYLKISLTGIPPATHQERAPINLALVLDRSGSMAGEKIEQARNAASLALDYLTSQDIFSIIAYSTSVEVLLPSGPLADKNQARHIIQGLQAHGSTALYAGVSQGGEEVRKFLRQDRVNRVILLSDGLANVGPQTPEALTELGRELAQDGITVTTLGLGLGYNEDLMAKLAYISDGNHAFIQEPAALIKIFNAEFNDVLSVVAQQIIVEIHCGQGVQPKRMLGRQGQIKHQQIHAQFNQLYANQEKYLLVELDTSSAEPGTHRELASVEVRYIDLSDNQSKRLVTQAQVHYTDSPQVVTDSADKEVMVAVAEQIATQTNAQAIQLRDEGKVEQARSLLRKNAEFLKRESEVWQSPKLQKQSEADADAAKNLDDGKKWQARRKSMRHSNHKKETQQAY